MTAPTHSPAVPAVDPAPPVRLAADGVRLAYGDRVVVDDLDLQLTDGSFTAIVGPNGCGKSTLLRALGRLLRPTAGTVLLDGRHGGGVRGCGHRVDRRLPRTRSQSR